jgi:transposase, IS30 family
MIKNHIKNKKQKLIKKSPKLSVSDRETLLIYSRTNHSLEFIGNVIGKHKSTISLEYRRDGMTRSTYSCISAQAHREEMKAIPTCSHKMKEHDERYVFMYDKLKNHKWSPEQIAKELTEKGMPISHETIYNFIYVQCKGELKKELISYLRNERSLRKKRGAKKEARGTIPDIVTIHERPSDVENRSIPGNWEGDLVLGKDHASAIGTLVERSTRLVKLIPLPFGKDAVSVKNGFIQALSPYPSFLKKSMTYDRGKEMSKHKDFTEETGISVYFCDPHSPWQRGTNENTNRLIRSFFPKGTDFNLVSREELQRVEDSLNDRIRKTLDWKTPRECFMALLDKKIST